MTGRQHPSLRRVCSDRPDRKAPAVTLQIVLLSKKCFQFGLQGFPGTLPYEFKTDFEFGREGFELERRSRVQTGSGCPNSKPSPPNSKSVLNS